MVIRILFFVLMKISCILFFCVSTSDKLVLDDNHLSIQRTGFSFLLIVSNSYLSIVVNKINKVICICLLVSYFVFIVSLQYLKFVLSFKDNIILLYFVTFIRCFKFPNSVVVRFIVTFTKFPIRHLNPHVYYYEKKMHKRRTWKGKESLSHEYKRSRRHTTVIFLSIYVTYWKPSPNLAPYHLSFASVKSRRVSAISYIQFQFSKFMFYCYSIFIFIVEFMIHSCKTNSTKEIGENTKTRCQVCDANSFLV